MNDYFKILYIASIFTVVIFFINYNFFWSVSETIENKVAEEKYIEEEIINIEEDKTNIIKSDLIKYFKEKSKQKYNFYFHPKSFETEIIKFKQNIEEIIIRNVFNSKIDKIDISLIKEKIDRRGKMKNKEIKLYWANNENEAEYISVFIHELWHYLDLYFLEKKVFLDLSNKFYEISWVQTKIKKENMQNKDFVSWYSMTNKYEDFAESFTYYILHNKDFLQKTKNSSILEKKYNFFADYIFKNREFFNTKFNEAKIEKYYRDITKIKLDINKLFNYLVKINWWL